MNKLTNVLTHHEFWIPLLRNFPLSTKLFLEWIDEYKQKTDFDKLFLNDRYHRPFGENLIKFHDLPDDMQFGIFLRYLWDEELLNLSYLQLPHSFDSYKGIELFFALKEEILKKDLLESQGRSDL